MSDPTTTRPPLTERIRAGEFGLGLIVKFPSTSVIETAGHLGYDVVVIDTEHGGDSVGELEHHLRAADSVGLDTLVRVADNDPVRILHALDAGATGIIVPHITSAEQATAAVATAHYPPTGTRGLALSTRAGGHSTASLAEHLERSRRDTVVVAQIEDTEGVKAAADIAAVPGITAVWPGPSDLSLTLGHPGQPDHPEVQAALDTIVESARDNAGLIAIADDEDDARRWRERGATILLFALPPLLAKRLRVLAETVRAGTAQ